MQSKVELVTVQGRPGSGKGSIMANIDRMAASNPNISIRKVEMGACFRQKAKIDPVIKDIMDSGGLISNSVVNGFFENLLNATVAAPLFAGEDIKEKMIVLLDGYPRTLPQWEYFLNYRAEKNLSVAGIFVELDEEIVMHRSTIRRICPKCGGTFSAEEYHICPHCGQSEGIRRADDLKMERRLRVFNEETTPVIEEAKSIFEHKIVVSGEDTKLASKLVWDFLQTL